MSRSECRCAQAYSDFKNIYEGVADKWSLPREDYERKRRERLLEESLRALHTACGIDTTPEETVLLFSHTLLHTIKDLEDRIIFPIGQKIFDCASDEEVR